MDRIFTRFTLAAFVILALSQWSARCLTPEAALEIPAARPRSLVWVSEPAPVVDLAEAPRANLDVPDTCRRLVVRELEREVDGRIVRTRQIGKEPAAWLRDTRERWRRQLELRDLVRVVVSTMGGDDLAAEMIWRKAIYESSGDPANVHVLNRDLAANRSAASKGRKRATERWRHARVPTFRPRSTGERRQAGDVDAWSLGRGLYGQVTGLHMHRWSADAPPWSLCDPIIATITVVWAMRAGLAECGGESLRDAYRRFSSGKCAVREVRLERRFDSLARGHVRGLNLEGFDPDATAVLGDGWPEASADREVLLAVLRARVAHQRIRAPR